MGRGVDGGDLGGGDGVIPEGDFRDSAFEPAAGEDCAGADGEWGFLPGFAAAGIVGDEFAVPVEGAGSGGEVHGDENHVPLVEERGRGRGVGKVSTGGGEEFELIVGFELEIEVVAVFRLAGNVEDAAGLGWELAEVDPGHDTGALSDAALLGGEQVAGGAIELSELIARSGDSWPWRSNGDTAFGGVSADSDAAFAGWSVKAVIGDGVGGGYGRGEVSLEGMEVGNEDAGEEGKCG